MITAKPKVQCREIVEADRAVVADLLTRGFDYTRTRAFWLHAFDSLSDRPTPAGYPRYGYALVADGVVVGVLLLIFARVSTASGPIVRCNVSSWYVEPAFRMYGTMLVSRSIKHRDVTYYNITPAPHTYPILEAQGYVRYCDGRFLAVPMLSARGTGGRVQRVTPDMKPGDDLSAAEIDVLLQHQHYGCISVVCGPPGARQPFVFAPRRRYGVVSFGILVYCRTIDSFVQSARPLGLFLAARGIPLVILDANGPVRGLVGKYLESYPKYFKGSDRPALGDIAFSERAVFGV